MLERPRQGETAGVPYALRRYPEQSPHCILPIFWEMVKFVDLGVLYFSLVLPAQSRSPSAKKNTKQLLPSKKKRFLGNLQDHHPLAMQPGWPRGVILAACTAASVVVAVTPVHSDFIIAVPTHGHVFSDASRVQVVLLFAVDAFHREHMRDAASVSTVAPAQHAPPET